MKRNYELDNLSFMHVLLCLSSKLGGGDISGVRKSKISSKLTAHNILCEKEQIIKIKSNIRRKTQDI